MADPVDLLVFAAQSKGASGVRVFLQGTDRVPHIEHRKQAPEILAELSAPVLLEATDGDNGDIVEPGVRIEQLPLRAQREIWSALASAPHRIVSPRYGTTALARAYLRVASRQRKCEKDTVCEYLAQMVLSAAASDGGNDQEKEAGRSDGAAFRRQMRRLTFSRVVFPGPHSDDNEFAFPKLSASRTRAKPSPPAPVHFSRDVAGSSTTTSKRTRLEQQRPTAERDGPRLKKQGFTKGQHAASSPLTKEMEDRASSAAKQLAQLSRAEARSTQETVDEAVTRAVELLTEVVSDVHTTYASNERSFQCLCQTLHLASISDEALFQITSALVDSNWSSRYASVFLETSVLPKIRAAASVISRVLLQTALCFGSSYGSTLIDSLLIPLLVGDAAKDVDLDHSLMGPPQAEAITRILSSPDTLPPEHLDSFIQKSLTAASEQIDRPHLLSNESVLLVFQNLLNAKPPLSPTTVGQFIGACEAALERSEDGQLCGSLKFATVVFTLISKYPQQCVNYVEALEMITSRLTSLMAKTTLRSLQKLKTAKQT